eukprot:m.13817 g.13817  ORF g.13817 m.13817 type:complete len:89 (-) comp7428_c0_seq1:1054-1320(-)
MREVDADVLVVGAGISGLTLGIALHRSGVRVLLVDKVKQMSDAGSGMSVIGHSLVILRELGVDLPATIGFKQMYRCAGMMDKSYFKCH